MEKQTIILEPSSNTHKLTGRNVSVEDLGDSVLKIKVQGEGIVTHGEHGVLKTESANIIKYTQKEFNPVTQEMVNAYD